ncbi:hypothetical protein Ciccas_011469, partial [Cichlidogyrus casuarinus]
MKADRYVKLPEPHFDMIVGGKLGQNGLPFHSIYIVPTSADSFKHACEIGATIYHRLRLIVKERYGHQCSCVTAKRAFAPPVPDTTT